MTQFFTFPHLCCPLDGEPLTGNETSLVCIKGHSFDIARKGYVNLLNVQYKRSKDPGDSKEMVLARRAFLEAGHFAPVSNHMNEIIKRLAHPNSEYSILDAGCGEGYYLDRLYRALGEDETSLKVSLSGVDISKQAIQAAAGRNKEIQWLVASNRQLPIQGETIDTIVCGFGFPVYESFAHVLKSQGRVLLIEAGENHLIELRELLYPELKERSERMWPASFTVVEQSQLRYSFELDTNKEIENLLFMTPHFFRASYEGKQRAKALNSLKLTADVRYTLLTKTNSAKHIAL